MILSLITTIIFVISVYFVKPYQLSLKEKELHLNEAFCKKKVSLYLGILVIFIFSIVSDFEFLSINDGMIEKYALSNNYNVFQNKLWTVFTHSFIHINLLHISVNLVGIIFLSIYETKVGSTRFFKVFIISIFGSIPSIYLFSEDIFTLGISGGLFGLLGAYLTDDKQLSLKNWSFKVIIFLAFYVFSTNNEIAISRYFNDFKIDYFGHLFGGLTGIIYCKIFTASQY